MRRLYVIPAGEDPATYQAQADANTCSEIVVGIPVRLQREGFSGTPPCVFIEPDDPDMAPIALAITQLRNTFKTTRTASQINNSIDALTVLMRRVFGELR